MLIYLNGPCTQPSTIISGEILRVITTLCDIALVYSFAGEAPRISKGIVLDAICNRKIGVLVNRDDQLVN